jgi:DNA repair exonuclease SbcCD ATPase subunit
VLGILGKIDLESIRKKQPVTVIVFNESEIKQAPRPKVYQALGDLDYAQLLKLDEREKSFQPDSIKEEKTTVAALPKTEPELIQVVGATPEEPSVTQVISGGQPAKQKERSSFRKPLGGVKGLIQGIFGKLWNRGQSSEGSEESDEGDYDEEWVVEGGPALDPNEGVVLVKDHLETDSLDDDGTTVIEGGHLDEVLRNARENLVTFKKDIKNEKTRLWMESLINDVMKERADLKQIHRKLNSSFRQKEFEFRKKYLLLQEELKLKDEEILKRETALNRTKEQLNQVTINIEKFKNVSQELSSEMQFRQKYHASQKMNQLAKEENAQLSRRIEELRVQLNAAQVARIQNSPTAELSALQIKYDRLYRQSEEFKKANRQLMEHLNEVKRDSGGMPNHVDELKSRLDAAMKLAMTSKKDAEMMRSKIAQMLQKESNLRAEVMKMKAQLNLSPSKIKGDGENQS